MDTQLYPHRLSLESAWLGLRFQPRNDSVCFSSGNLRFVPHLPTVLLGTLFLPSPQNAKNLAAAICIPLVGLGFLYGFGYFRLPRHPLPQSATVIRLVQPAIPQAMKWNPQTLENNFQKYISMSKAPAGKSQSRHLGRDGRAVSARHG